MRSFEAFSSDAASMTASSASVSECMSLVTKMIVLSIDKRIAGFHPLCMNHCLLLFNSLSEIDEIMQRYCII